MATEASTGTSQPASPAQEHRSPGRLRLRRSDTDRYLAGIAGGLGERFAVDPFIIRAALLGSTLFAAYALVAAPIIPIAYTLGWLLIPGTTGTAPLRDLRSGAGRREALAAIVSFVVITILLSRPSFGIALALAALAWVLLSDRQTSVIDGSDIGGSDDRIPGPAPAQETAELEFSPDDSLTGRLGPPDPIDGDDSIVHGQAPVNAATNRSATAGPAVSGTAAAGDGETAVDASRFVAARWGRRRRIDRGDELVARFAPPRRARRQPALWPLTIALLVIVAVVGFTADRALDGGVDPAVLVNIALIVVGAVLVMSAWRGRALWTTLIAMALIPLWIGFSVADIGRFDGLGSARYEPTAVPASGQLAYENGYGSMTVDLRSLPLDDGDTLDLDLGTTAGTIKVFAPHGAEVVVRSHIGFGSSTVQSHGLEFWEYDREPYLDRTTTRRYPAHGDGCVNEWAAWSYLVDLAAAAGIDVDGRSADDPADVEPILDAFERAGYERPQPVDESQGYGVVIDSGSAGVMMLDEDGDHVPSELVMPAGEIVYDQWGNPMTITGSFGSSSFTVIDEFGNEYLLDAEQARAMQLALDAGGDPAGGPDAWTVPVVDRAWSYNADHTGRPCIVQPPPQDPAVIEINATVGVGTLEVHRDEF